MICIGDKKLKRCFLGDVPIKKVYQGDDLLYRESGYAVNVAAEPAGAGEVTGAGMYAEGAAATLTAVPNGQYKFVKWLSQEAPQRLPEGYTELEYIETDKACGFDTGVKVNLGTMSFTMDIEADSYSSESEYIYRAAGSVYLNLYRSSATQLKSNIYSSTLSTLTKSLSGRTSISFQRGTVVVDNLYLSNANTGTTTNNLFLFAATASLVSIQAKLYSAKIYEEETLIRDFIPCIDPAGTAGLYDLAEGKFYPNSWTGTVTPGPAARTIGVSETVSFTPTEDTVVTAVFERILPEEYTVLQYIESPGVAGQGIDTGKTSRSSTRISVELEILDGNFSGSTTSKALVYSNATSVMGSSSYYTGIRILFTSAEKVLIQTWSNSNSSAKNYTFDCERSPAKTKIEVDMLNKTAYVNGVSQAIVYTDSNFSGTNARYNLFAYGSNYSKCRLYSYKYYWRYALMQELIPCMSAAGEIGVYDLVSKVFLTSATSGLLIAGPAV